MQKTNENIGQITRTNELIVFEFYNRMKGVINNRYNKSKGWQFAMLEKNLNEMMDYIFQNNEKLWNLFGRSSDQHLRQTIEKISSDVNRPLDTL